MNFKRGLLALATAALLVFGLTGCFAIVTDSPSQQNLIGDVVVHTVACVTSGTNTDSCTDAGNSGETFADNAGQLMLAYRVPDGYGAPTQVNSTSGSPPLVMNQNASYASQLTGLAPPPSGEHWVGYLSQTLSPPAANQQYVFDTHFTRPPAQNGVPAGAPFKYLTVVGGRTVSPTDWPATRDVFCGTSFAGALGDSLIGGAYQTGTSDASVTECVDSPAVGSSDTALPGDTTLPTRDLAVAPGSAMASRNSTVNVPFTLNFAGASDASAVFTLASAVNGLAGATAKPANATFVPPANSSTVQNVAVQVPLKAPAGTYDVPFSATLANGQTRQAVGKLTVLPDTAGPHVTISIAKTRLRKGRSKGFRITVGCSEDCSLLATLTASSKALAARTVKLGSAKAKLPAAGKTTLTVKLGRTGKRKVKALVKRHRRLRAKLTIVATDALGHRTRASKRVSVK
jgi:hypothetical protein